MPDESAWTRLRIEPSGADRRLRVSGELDLATAPALESGLSRLARTPGDIVVDLSGITFIDCVGLRALLAADEEPERRGRLVWHDPSACVRRLLELLGSNIGGRYPRIESARGGSPRGAGAAGTREPGRPARGPGEASAASSVSA